MVILGVSSVWNNDKGLSDFIELSRNPDFVVVLVGLQPDQVEILRNEKYYKACNLILICRTQNQQELAMIYSLADVFVNPTYADMFPTVNLEALACSTPVITYRTGGSPEAVDEKTGVVVEQGDIDGLTEAIYRIGKHSLLLEDCRKRAVECYDKDKCYGKYLDLYEKLLKETSCK